MLQNFNTCSIGLANQQCCSLAPTRPHICRLRFEAAAVHLCTTTAPQLVHQHTLGDLTQNFPTFSKPILNLDFYIKTDPGSTQVSNIQENNVESCTNFRFCHQAPIFQLRLFLGPIFGRKNIFNKTNIQDGQKVLLSLQFAFVNKIKIFVLQTFWDF